ncbi:MAG: response regulator [Lachnospiraceae bacterium]|nr:response regulator [Lachnospiraceae bacterium]
MNPEKARQERNEYVIFVLTLSYGACAVGLILENIIVGWEPWAIPFLVASAIFAWWIHLTHPFTEKGRVYALALVFYAITFYQGVHESSLFDVSLIICFVFFTFSLADVLRVYDIGMVVYFCTIIYQIAVHQGLVIFTNPLTLSRMLLHILIVFLSSRFAKSMIHGRQRAAEMEGRVIKQLADMNRRADGFMANVSHELRTPINAVTGLSSILMEKNNCDIKCDEMLAINRAGHRLSEQVGDILDYTEIDNGRLVLSHDIYEIFDIINDVIENLRESERKENVELVIDVDASVPSKLGGDARRIAKILWHLTDNAYKFTQTGGIYIRVTSDHRDYGVNLNIEVDDTGVGIPKEEQHRITLGHYQADTGKAASAGGMGLGLAIVFGFAHAMGGFVTLSSAPGQGTSVKVTIPQTVVDQTPCMSVPDPEQFYVVVYLGSEKYSEPMVRDYIEQMISHLVRGLHIPIRRVGSLDDLKHLLVMTKPTHLFTAQAEYNEERSFFKEISDATQIVVLADREFAANPDSGVTILRKPIYSYPIAGIMNNTISEESDINATGENVEISFPGLSALVVDDDDMNLVVANGIFTGYGMNVTTASSGKESIQIYESRDFDVVFMDHMMPEMDGVETVSHLNQIRLLKNRNTKFVALTANAVSGAKEMFLENGFDGFLPKPIVTKELEQILMRILPSTMFRIREGEESITKEGRTPAAEGSELGIMRLMGDRELYVRLRDIFIGEMQFNLRVFRSAYATGTMEPYRIRLRALRDGSRLIGEEKLARLAGRLEQAIASGDDFRIRREHQDLCSFYENRVKELTAAKEKEVSDAQTV